MPNVLPQTSILLLPHARAPLQLRTANRRVQIGNAAPTRDSPHIGMRAPTTRAHAQWVTYQLTLGGGEPTTLTIGVSRGAWRICVDS